MLYSLKYKILNTVMIEQKSCTLIHLIRASLGLLQEYSNLLITKQQPGKGNTHD